MLQEGTVEAGLPWELVERPEPHWTAARADRVMHHLKSDYAQAAELAALPTLSASWKNTLRTRAEKHTYPDAAKRLNDPHPYGTSTGPRHYTPRAHSWGGTTRAPRPRAVSYRALAGFH